jgi:hypothetical protein
MTISTLKPTVLTTSHLMDFTETVKFFTQARFHQIRVPIEQRSSFQVKQQFVFLTSYDTKALPVNNVHFRKSNGFHRRCSIFYTDQIQSNPPPHRTKVVVLCKKNMSTFYGIIIRH